MGISQSALSKMESGILIPSIHQWFEFCSSASIPVESHVHGYLDRMELIRFQDKLTQTDFKVADIYRNDAGSSARSMAPLIQWLYAQLGDVKAKKLVKEMGVDPDYFANLNSQINFRFFVDLFQVMRKKGIYKKTDITQVTNQVASQRAHGGLYAGYQQATDVESLLRVAFSKSTFYEVNFDYQLEEVSQKKIAFSVSPKEHLMKNKELQYAESCEFLNDYRGGYFKSLVDHLQSKQVSVKDVICVSNQMEKNVYEMSYS